VTFFIASWVLDRGALFCAAGALRAVAGLRCNGLILMGHAVTWILSFRWQMGGYIVG